MRVKKCNKTAFKSRLNMKLLAFLLIITEIFILFNLQLVQVANGATSNKNYEQQSNNEDQQTIATNREDDNNHHLRFKLPLPPSELAFGHTNKQDNISSFLAVSTRHQKLEQVIRVSSGIDIATTATIIEPQTRIEPNAFSVEQANEEEGEKNSSFPLLLSSSSSSKLPKNKTEMLDFNRYHHSSELVDVNALVDGKMVEGSSSLNEEQPLAELRESNPLIERHKTTKKPRRNKRQLDNEEVAALVSAITAPGAIEQLRDSSSKLSNGMGSNSGENNHQDDDELNNDNVQVNEQPPPPTRNLPSNEHRVYQKPMHYHHHGHNKNIRAHFSVENHEGESGRRFRNKNGYCHRDCSSSSSLVFGGHSRKDSNGGGDISIGLNGQNQKRQPEEGAEQQQQLDSLLYKICGSDGHFYGSICELKRHSCRQNIHLYRKPKAFCLRAQHKSEMELEMEEISKPMINYHQNGSEEVRIVELKRRCNTMAYNEMKLLLIREFNGDLSSMFKYFDSNGDNFIEAHELWPKQEEQSNKLRYAQVWDEHSSKCRRRHHHNSNNNYDRLKNHLAEEDSTKCWFFLDFAFEPQFSSNPCSLSHLMLFDLKHPNNRFNFDSFKQAFEDSLRALGNKSTSRQEPIRRTSTVQLRLGDSKSLGCLINFTNQELIETNVIINNEGFDDGLRCLWTRYDLNLGAIQDPHIHIEKQRTIQATTENNIKRGFNDLTLHLKDAQLYLSGHFKCACHSKRIERTFEHLYTVQVLAEPRVSVRPKFQWSLPASRISFECQYDYIDTKEGNLDSTTQDGDQEARGGKQEVDSSNDGLLSQLDEKGQFGLRVKWLKDNSELVVDSKKFNGLNQSQLHYLADNGIGSTTTLASREIDYDSDEDSFYSAQDDNGELGEGKTFDSNSSGSKSGHEHEAQAKAFPKQLKLSYSSHRASITMAASRLTLENLTSSDSGQHTCRVDVPNNHEQYYEQHSQTHLNHHNHHVAKLTTTENSTGVTIENFGLGEGTLLVQEQPKSDQSSATSEIYGTYLWMFHDNGISIYRLQNDDGQEMELLREINGHSLVSGEVDGNWNQLTLCGGLNPEQVVICEWSDNALHINVKHGLNSSKTRKYIYVGQPNLNRIIVMDGLKFEIVAIINTEPQPRKLYLYNPSKIHLSKWVRRRLSPAANARWLDSIGTHAHSLKSTPDSKLYSMASAPTAAKIPTRQRRFQSHEFQASRGRRSPAMTNQKPSPLIQHDIWLLCYGQPLIVDPSGDEHLEEADSRFYSALASETLKQSSNTTSNSHKQSQRSIVNSVQPFTPRLTAGPPFGWPVWPNKEAKLRNRKSVHIVQSTFFPPSTLTDDSLHNHDESIEEEGTNIRRVRNDTVVGEFKRSTVITTHHVFSGISTSLSGKPQLYLARPQFDLIQDLYVPPKPYSLESNDKHKIHYAYVTHYDDRRLFRVSMDEYRYDREIDLQNCDPINLVTTAQGLLVIQCRAPIAHNLTGQLVLDQLTSSRIEFNPNIRAQESYLSPDHRYLVSVFSNSTLLSTPPSSASSAAETIPQSNHKDNTRNQRKRSTNQQDSVETKRQSIIYVQLVTMAGLRLQYEIKTTLEISQCSFVWKDGYYAAIFVSTNRRDDQSEILSLRLADSRLQLMARVPGLISAARHKDQLIVSPELRLAALSTNQGTYVVDLEDNRVSQSLRHHQSPPTLLWV